MIKKLSVSISKLTFSGGSSFDLNKADKVILVGPNNSGKSQTLREILSVCGNGKKDNTFVVKGVDIVKDGTAEGVSKCGSRI